MNKIREWTSDSIDTWHEADWIGRGVAVFTALVAVGLLVITIALVHNYRTVTGTITGKDHTPAHNAIVTRCAPTVNGNCTMVTTTEYRPDSWTVTIAPDDGSSDVFRAVSESYWNTAQPGDRWSD